MIEIKRIHPDAKLPKYGTSASAGLDLISVSETVEIPPLRTAMVGTGIAINMMTLPEHLMAIIVPRSGKGAKEGKVLGNLTGIIDQDYQGELKISVWNRNPEDYIKVEKGEAIAQLIFVPIFKERFVEVVSFSEATERGEGGFGSTGA